MKPIHLVVCADKKGGIGKNGSIPWDIYVDRVFFNNLTTKGKNAVVMGRITYESLKAPLSERLNVVITKSKLDVLTYSNLNQALDALEEMDVDQIFIIGGAQLYKEAMKYATYLYYNEIQKEYDCDVFVEKPFFICLENLRFDLKDKDEVVQVCFRKYVNPRKYNLEFVHQPSQEMQYIHLLQELMNLNLRETRNGRTYSAFNKQLIFDAEPFPILTSKKVNFLHVVEELLWFLKGETNSKILESKGVNIWKKNSSKEFLAKMNLNYQEGDIGPMYGFQLVHFGEEYNGFQEYGGYNQLDYVVDLIKTDPTSRRILMTTFNPKQAKEGVLYPCHGIVSQFYVEDGVLHLSTYQRSADVFLGLPWNISSYALLLHIVAHLTGKKVGKLIITLGDYHLYEEHYEKAAIQILRAKLGLYEFPNLKMKPFSSISELDSSYFELENYESYKGLVAEMKS